MGKEKTFSGLTEDTYRFFMEIGFHNDRAFFEANRDRYRKSVQEPLWQLTEAIAPAALDVDPNFETRPSRVVSRIRRDTRFSRDKSLYRDHAWLCFKYPQTATSEEFVLYAEFNIDSYGYGMGMYAPSAARMAEIRSRILARPNVFLKAANAPGLQKFTLVGETYKRPKCPDAPDALQPWLNRKAISYCFASPDVKQTYSRALVDEITEGFFALKEMYRLIRGLPADGRGGSKRG